MTEKEIHTHDLIGLVTLSSIFRNAVEQGYAKDWFVHQTIAVSTPRDVLDQIYDFQMIVSNAYAEDDYSRDYYIAALEHNERCVGIFANVVGDDALRSYMPQGVGGEALSRQFSALGCPKLAGFFAKPVPPKPSRDSKAYPK